MNHSPPGSSVHGILQARILQANGVASHFLLQGTFPIHGSNHHLLQLLHWQVFFFFLTTEPPGKPLAMFYLFKKRSNSNSSKFLHHKIIKGDFTFTCFLQAPLGPKCTSDAYQYVCREGSLPFCLSVRRRAARRPATSWPPSLPCHTCPGQRLASRACHRHPAHSALTSPLCASFPTGSWQHYRKGNY